MKELETKGCVYLHAVVFVVHILDPGDELAGVEAVSHRLVLIALRTRAAN